MSRFRALSFSLILAAYCQEWDMKSSHFARQIKQMDNIGKVAFPRLDGTTRYGQFRRRSFVKVPPVLPHISPPIRLHRTL